MSEERQFTAAIRQDGDWWIGWIGWIEEVPGVNCQEASKEELIDTLTVTLQEILEECPTNDLSANIERELISI